MLEIQVKIQDSEQCLTQKFLCDEGIVLSHDDPAIKRMVEDTISKFIGKPEEVTLKIKADW